MFTPKDRTRLFDASIDAARTGARITAAAVTGSAAIGAADRWPDISLTRGLDLAVDRDWVIADWNERMYRMCDAVRHLDVFWESIPPG